MGNNLLRTKMKNFSVKELFFSITAVVDFCSLEIIVKIIDCSLLSFLIKFPRGLAINY